MGGVSMEWKEVRLGDIADVQTGPFGSQLHKSDYIAEGIPCIMPTNIGPHLNFIVDGIAHVSEVDANRLSRHLTEIGDIIYARRGDIEKCAYVTTNEEKWLCGTGCLKIRCNNEVNSRFIAYLLSTAECKKWITGNAVGTTMLNLSKGILSNLPLLVPSHEDQRRIASILSSLDRKIELNNKINADLEEMAQAIFKNWFVDFEPFKDGKFVDSELGMIPEGWKVGKITDIGCLITDYVSNGSFASLKQNVHLYETKEYAQFIRNTDLKTNTFSVYVDKHSYDFLSKSTLYGNEIIISNVGDVGSVHLCPKLDIPMTLGNNIIMLRPNEKEYNYFLYLWFKYFSGQGLIQGIKGGSAQPKFNKTDFKNLPMLIPSFEIIERSYWIFESMFSILSSNVKENSRLSLLRDTLLPRLMSGELEVPE